MRYIDVDVGKRRCRAYVMDGEGVVVDEFAFDNTYDGVRMLLEEAERSSRISPRLTSASL